jgi:2-polyprenyl-6-methoxyphenol hydroxylase-like FAD-dependent oxidoreductase
VSAQRERAVVIGASMAGLVAARVLAEHYREVTVLERDRLPAAPGPRNGVPQARHTHVLLVRGRQILEQYFPGIVEELVADGATLFDSTADARFLTPLGWLPRFKTGLSTVSCTRGLLEWHVRRRLAGCGNVLFVEEVWVTGLIQADGMRRVNGVSVRSRSPGSDRPETFFADLVVDASGRDSSTPQWLTRLGRAQPPQKLVNSYVGYSTRIFTRPEGGRDWLIATIHASPPDATRAAVILPIEGNRWIATMVGYARDYPPTDEAGFMDFARSLRDPIIFEALREAEPLTPIVGYRRTENNMHLYERVDDWPQGLIVVGDAVCCFNPIYGQGMTNAAICATILQDLLRGTTREFEAEFQKRLARHNSTPWLLATNEDFRFPQTEGERPRGGTRLIQRYIDRLFIASVEDPEIFEAFISVAHLLKGPGYLFRPKVVAKVLWHALTHLRPPANRPASPTAAGETQNTASTV